MKTFDVATLAALNSGRIGKRDMILFDFPSGLHGYWTGQGVLTYASIDYIGAGGLLSMEALNSAMGLAATAVVCRLNAIPNSDLTPNMLAAIEEEQWHQRPVTISRVYFDLDTRALLSVERMFRGYLDKIDHEEQVGGGYTLACYLESKARDHLKKGHRVRGDADQRRINPSDGGLRYVAVAGQQEIPWGREAKAVAG